MIKKLGLIVLLCISLGAQAEEATISIAFVGDVMLDETPGQYIKQGKDPFKDFEKILKESDLRIANLECVVSGKKGKAEEKPYAFKAHPRVLPVLKKHFSAVSLANNHSYDYGEITFLETLGLLEKAGLPYLGGGRDIFQAHEPRIFNVKGKKLHCWPTTSFFREALKRLPTAPAWPGVKMNMWCMAFNARGNFMAPIM